MQTIAISRTAVSDWDVTWRGIALGGVNKVTPKIELVTKEIKIGSVGDVKLGQRIIGLEGTIEVEVREIDHTMYEDLSPWNNGSTTTSLPLMNTRPSDLYDYAGVLTLHPSHLASNVTTLDLNLLKAVARIWTPQERDGVNDDINLVTFEFFPDRASLPNLVYGYVGPVP